MPILRLPGTLCSLSDEFLLSIHSLPDIPAAMLDWELHVHPNEREMTGMSNEWFARLSPRQCPSRPPSYFSLCTAINYFRPTYTRNGQLVNSPFWLQCVTQLHLTTSYCAYCSPNAFIWLTSQSNRFSMDYTCVVFSYDDLMDVPGDNEETKYMHDARGVEKAAQMLLHIFKKPEEFKPIDTLPVLTAFHE